jgi:hypothetical protein
MMAIHCGECETPLEAVETLTRDASPYPSLWLTCPRCGAAWRQDARGVLIQARERLVRVPICV